MKHKLLSFAFAASAIMALLTIASCSKVGTDLLPQDDGRVKLSAGISALPARAAATKTTNGGSTWSDGDAVGIYMLDAGGTLPTDLIDTGDGANDNLKYTVVASTGALTADPTDGHTMFFRNGTKADFIAYYPWRTTPGQSPYVYGVDVSDQTAPASIDLLWTRKVDVEKTTNNVELKLAHALTKLTMNIVAGDGIDPTDITALMADNVAIDGFYSSAAFDLGSGTLSGQTLSGSALEPLQVTTAEAAQASFEAILIPMGAKAERTVTFAGIGGEDFVWKIDEGATFARATHYTYTITVNKTGVTFDPAVITPWDESANAIPGDSGLRGIRTEADLRRFSADWNATYDASYSAEQIAANKEAVIARWSDDGTATGTIRVRADITMDPSNGNFTPIGQGTFSFSGGNDYFNAKFDGGGFTITGLTVNVTTTGYAGLFGYIAAEGEVSNVKLTGAEVSASGSSSYSGGIAAVNYGSIAGCAVVAETISAAGGMFGNYSGGIAALNYGSIAGCSVVAEAITASGGKETNYSGGIAGGNSGSIAGCTVEAENISATGSSRNYSGGIAGENSGSIAGCTVDAKAISTIGSSMNYSGGIAGDNSGSIAGCSVVAQDITASGGSSGNHSGGIVGRTYGASSIAGCLVVAQDITASGGLPDDYSGGIVGRIFSASSIAGCHWLNEGSQPGNAVASGGGAESNCYTFTSAADFGVEMVNWMNNAIYDYNAGADADKLCDFHWKEGTAGVNDGYPTLVKDAPQVKMANGIYSEWGLRQFSADWNATYDDSYSVEQIAANKEAVIARWSDDGTATGTIRVRADITMDPSNGNFTPIGQGLSSFEKNDHFNAKFDGGGFTITGLTIDLPSGRYYAGLFGYIAAEGAVSNVKLTGAEVSASGSSSYSGGIAGQNGGSITGCSVVAESISATGSYMNYSGGIAGQNSGSITGCSVVAESISATGSTMNYSGGIAGQNSGSITGCSVVADAIIVTGGNETNYSGGIAGENNSSGSIAGCTVEADAITASGGFNTNYSGGIAGGNSGSIAGCSVVAEAIFATGGSISCSGGIAGVNNGSIAGCSVVVTQTISSLFMSGGIAGDNSGSIAGCSVVAQDITASGGFSGNHSGGIVGRTYGASSIAGCLVVAESISATGNDANNYSGGIAGITFSGSSIAGCLVVAQDITASGGFSDNYSGGIVGRTFSGSSIAGCHWLRDNSQPANAVGQNQGGTESNCYIFTSAADFIVEDFNGIGAGVILLSLMNDAIADYNSTAADDKKCYFIWRANPSGYPTLVANP